MLDVDELRERFLNLQFDTKSFEIDLDKAAAAARLAGEQREQFTNPGHPDFEVLPAFLASFASGRRLPIDFPSLGGIGMDGGKAVTSIAPVRPGETITGKTHLHDIYDKSGRSGRMIFLVTRMEIFDAEGTHLATSDSRMVVREKPAAGEAA